MYDLMHYPEPGCEPPIVSRHRHHEVKDSIRDVLNHSAILPPVSPSRGPRHDEDTQWNLFSGSYPPNTPETKSRSRADGDNDSQSGLVDGPVKTGRPALAYSFIK